MPPFGVLGESESVDRLTCRGCSWCGVLMVAGADADDLASRATCGSVVSGDYDCGQLGVVVVVAPFRDVGAFGLGAQFVERGVEVVGVLLVCADDFDREDLSAQHVE